MAWFELKSYRRTPGGASAGQPSETLLFEARDEETAKSEARRLARGIPEVDFHCLSAGAGAQVDVWESQASRSDV